MTIGSTPATWLRPLCSVAAVLAVAVTVGLAGTAAEAQSSEVSELRERLGQNREAIEAAEHERTVVFAAVAEARAALDAADRELQDATQRLEELEAELAAAETALAEAMGRLHAAVLEYEAAARRLFRAQEVLDRQVAELRTQLAAAYMYGGSNTSYLGAALDAVSESTSVTEYLTTLDKLHSGAERKNDIVAEVERSVADVAARRGDVERLRLQRQIEEDRARTARDDVADLTAAQDLVVEQVAHQREVRAELLTGLEVDKERAEALLDDLFGESQALTAELAKYRWHAGAPGAGGLAWPTDGQVTSGFGLRQHPILDSLRLHQGIDIPAPSGQAILASADGTVVSAGSRGGYGQTVIIAHGGGIMTLYAHLSRIDVGGGQEVRQGDPIGAIGSTGLSTGPHLHFEVRQNGAPVDPMAWF